MPLDDGQSSAKRYTPESTLDMMAEYIRGGLPLTSCHTQVADWIKTEESLKPTDEIVMFGQEFFSKTGSPRPTIMHSVIMRDGDILADPLTTGRYDPETEKYTSRMHEGSTSEETDLDILHRVSVIDFLRDHGIVPPDFEPETGDELGF